MSSPTLAFTAQQSLIKPPLLFCSKFHWWYKFLIRAVFGSAGPSMDQSGPDGEEIIRIHLICSEGPENNQVWVTHSLDLVPEGNEQKKTCLIMCECVNCRRFYDEGAIMLGEEAGLLADTLIGLNTIDFRCQSCWALLSTFSLTFSPCFYFFSIKYSPSKR